MRVSRTTIGLLICAAVLAAAVPGFLAYADARLAAIEKAHRELISVTTGVPCPASHPVSGGGR
ncbi:hypothetical protein [Bailinhaonella thermotolerans]|uniref:Uncharacterized protein n=1 Tax=Bailinhaonella thermotolerans TaxID=1070861 RepID=A0A3A4A6B6_9ACTN|nr:hypothetical protein [Bailinhaonella thermotolerans]RJL24115.1 hypothetical protein D5H75_30130 [Bailinhaonella thermotolerans]